MASIDDIRRALASQDPKSVVGSQEPNAWSEELGYYYAPTKSYENEPKIGLKNIDSGSIDVTGMKKTLSAKPMSDEVAVAASKSAPVDDSKIQELIQKYNVTRQLQQPQQAIPSSLSTPIDTKVKREPMSLSTALMGLIPVGVDLATGGKGAGIKVAGKYWEEEGAKAEAQQKSLEQSLRELEKARQMAAIKYGAKSAGKGSLDLKEIDVNGEPIFMPEEVAIGQKAWKKPEKGTAPKDYEAKLDYFKKSNEFLYGLKNKLKEGELNDKKKSDIAKLEDSLSRQWGTSETTKTTKKMSAAYNQLINIDPHSKDPMKDLGVIFDYMRFLDPNSTVRESEQSLVLGAKTYGDFISNMQDIITRKVKLTPNQIKGIQKFVAMKYLDRLETQKKIGDEEYIEKAKKRGLDPSMVVGKTSVGVPMYVKQGASWVIKNIPEDQVEDEKAKGALPIGTEVPESEVQEAPSTRINRAMTPRPQSPSPVSSRRPTFEEWKASKGL